MVLFIQYSIIIIQSLLITGLKGASLVAKNIIYKNFFKIVFKSDLI